MTFKISEYDLIDIQSGLKLLYKEDIEYKPLIQTISSILAWIQTMPPEDRLVYLLGRKA